jgi:predicted protein tyrosine phosphatase
VPVATSSLDALPGAVAAWRPDAIVSIHTPGRPAALPPGVPALRLPFADIEAAGPGGCESPHLSAFVTFHAAHRGQRLLIHCTAGLSRSPAYAILALMLDGMTVGDSCAMVAAAVPEVSPNRRVLWHAETLLNLHRGAIVHEAVRTFAYRHGAHGAAGLVTGLREVVGTPPSRVLPQGANPGGHLGAGGARHTEIRGVRTPRTSIRLKGLPVRTDDPLRYAETHLVEVRTLRGYERNARTHPEEQIAQLMGLISTFGFLVPLIVDEHDTIIAGHGRLEAAKRLGLARVPVVVRPGLNEAQRAALVLADNRVVMNSGWAPKVLAKELTFIDEAIAAGEFEIDLTVLDLGLLTASSTMSARISTSRPGACRMSAGGFPGVMVAHATFGSCSADVTKSRGRLPYWSRTASFPGTRGPRAVVA